MENERIIWDYLMEKIGSAYGAAGVMGNLYAESALEAKNLQNSFEKKLGMTDEQYTAAVDAGSYNDFATDGAGYGLAQWTYSTRKAALLNYAWARKVSIGDLNMQLEYLWQELSGGYRASVLEPIRAAGSVREASDIVLTRFERPADQGEAMKARRAGYGAKYYALYAAAEAAFRATGAGLADFAEAVYAAGWVYWYGTCGHACAESLLRSKAAQYPAHYGAERTARYRQDIAAGKRCADCVGIIKAYFWLSGKLDGKIDYQANGCPDRSADGLFALCGEKGPIGTMPEERGLVVHKGGHIGVYVGGGYTVEMRGFAYGCQRRKLGTGSWTEWGRLPASMIACPEAPGVSEPEKGAGVPANPASAPLFAYCGLLRRGSKGAAVKALQSALNGIGFISGAADGEFGPKTEAAVKRLQGVSGLDVDGVFGPLTYAALKYAYERGVRA